MKKIKKPHALSAEKVAQELKVAIESGLEKGQINQRQRQFEKNKLRSAKRKSAWKIFSDQFKSLIIFLLSVAAVASFAMAEWIDGVAISVAILVNTIIGFVTELKAVRSMEALEKLGKAEARVRRDGEIVQTPSENLTVGDVIVLEGGDLVSADVRIVEAHKLMADESALTGESTPVEKKTAAVDEDASLAERSCMLFKGTAVVQGSGEAVVVAVGMDTKVGKIADLVEEAEEEATPLEKRLDKLGRKLLYVILAITVVIAGIGLLSGRPLFLMVEMAVALAVAAIPEGLPIVATIALARGMQRMAKKNALVNRLSAVETLGSTTVIFTDKTGTLTENRMTLEQTATESGTVVFEEKGDHRKGDEKIDPLREGPTRELLEICALCTNASYSRNEDGKTDSTGDPVEVALLAAALDAGIDREGLLEKRPEVREEPFDSNSKMMATFHEIGTDGLYVAVKGSPEKVLENCDKIRANGNEESLGEKQKEKWIVKNRELAENGLRILAFASKTVESEDAAPYERLTFVGLAGLLDPPRKDVEKALAECRDAGIKVVMVTGDQAPTAGNIAVRVGLTEKENLRVVESSNIPHPEEQSEEERQDLLEVPVFARVDPGQKLDLVELHQQNGAVVAMTGDGVNDAPALKKADIGIAMGKKGTQVAREAADIVLKDDAFSTIEIAVQMGRVIFGNIRKFVLYLLSGNVSEVLVVSLALLAATPLPLLPLQILYLNMLSDVFPALALGLSSGSSAVMERPPRDPGEPVMDRRHWAAIVLYSAVIAASVLGAMYLAYTWLGLGDEGAVTVSFLTLAFARLWHVFNMRDRESPILANDIVMNPFVWGALAICVAMLLLGTYVGPLAKALSLTPPSAKTWALIFVASLVPLLAGQACKLLPLDSFMGKLRKKQ